ncbi:MAG: MarR family transcriptional regulator [Kiritimatiellaeota bacterium]|nr:MarR family transcriptional regulator [Kiritimatiellota bacterium]
MFPIWSAIHQVMKDRMSGWDLHAPAVLALLHIHSHPEDAEPARLSECIFVPRQTMTFTLDTLEKQGLVTRKPHPNDRRRKTIVLSGKGKKLAEAIIGDLLHFEAAALSEFSAQEFEAFRALSQKFANALQQTQGGTK